MRFAFCLSAGRLPSGPEGPFEVKAIAEDAILIPEEQYELVDRLPALYLRRRRVEDNGEIKLLLRRR